MIFENSLAGAFPFVFPDYLKSILRFQEIPATITKGFMNIDCFIRDTGAEKGKVVPTVYVQAFLYMCCPFVIGICCMICFIPYCRAKKPAHE